MLTQYDLMLGDLVRTHRGIREVEELSSTCALLDWPDYGCTVKDVEPIPITQELLEQNNFSVIEEHPLRYRVEYNEGILEGWLTGTSLDLAFHDSSAAIHIDYLHELQHLFKALKINHKFKYLEPKIKEAYDEGYKVGTDDVIRRLAYVYDAVRQTAKIDAYAEAGAMDIDEVTKEQFEGFVK